MKKLLTLVTAVVLVVALSACQPPEDYNPNDNNSSDFCPATTPDLSPIDFTTNKIELNFLAPSAGTFNPDQDPTKGLIEELTGYTVNYTQLPQGGSAAQALNLSLGSRDEYHAVKVTRNQYEQLVQDCALLNLAPYIDEYAENMQDAISDQSWATVTIGDAIYGIPEATSSENIDYTIGVRQDWLDELDLEMPETLEEFTTMLEEFDAYYGKDKPEFSALTYDQNQYMIGAISSAFSLYTEWQDVDGTLVNFAENPNTEDYIDYMKDLYDAGLIDSSVGSNGFSDAMNKFVNGNSGAIVMAWWNSIAVVDALEAGSQVGAEIAYMNPLENEDGERYIERGTGVPYITVIPVYMAEEAPYTINWLDTKLDDDIFREIVIGEEGTHYTYKASDDTYHPGAKFSEKENSSWFLTGTREDDYSKYWQARVRKNDDMYASWYALNKDADIYGVYDPLAFAPSIPEYSDYATLLAEETKAFINPYIVTNSAPTFSAWVTNWENLGGSELRDALNEWYKNK